ncbi:hypothetical protein HPB48_015744 [Haemaphysalis longicornis]|uniref:Sphingomyelin phosphodiesterase n=1 Tax=Haemaphysalis longicornis TaxID=44386 RepID=A0A9J6H5P0_HAELO|nr:hypothetical protein HPB48_015744 [Haemaphysalis longicornis]
MSCCKLPATTREPSAVLCPFLNTQIELVLWTGDLPPHDPWKAKREDMLENLRVTSALIRKYFPNATVVPSIGNHEAVPVNRGAFYSVEVAKGFKVISLNTNLCYLYNWWLLYNSTDPSGQLQWLADELQRSEDSGEKVYIIGHVAPVKVECIPVWADNFRRIVDRYESTIVAQFYGHTHLDHMYLFYRGDGADKDGRRPTNVAYLAPSVTTFTNSNPAYRVFTVDGGRQSKNASWTLLDHETYVMDLIESNKGEKPLWNLVYTAKQHYGLQSLSPSQWHRLAEAFKTNETLFQDYHRSETPLPTTNTRVITHLN